MTVRHVNRNVREPRGQVALFAQSAIRTFRWARCRKHRLAYLREGKAKEGKEEKVKRAKCSSRDGVYHDLNEARSMPGWIHDLRAYVEVMHGVPE
jgi:hypothetical protein